ncbi:LAFA_0G18602g1_1 [Lachancea sp. 'fantastica']|nr:LAFA_0G18602g1_1 [Lachancea sp. 'fantastica']
MTPFGAGLRSTQHAADLEELERLNVSLLDQFHKLSDLNNVNYSADKVIKEHISHLKRYNELRDTGLALAQMIADEKNCKIKEVFEEMNYDMSDKL